MRATIGAFAAIVVALFIGIGFATGGGAKAAGSEYGLYCLNGASTTLPATVSYSGGSFLLSYGFAEQIIANAVPPGVFYVGVIDGHADIWYATEPLDPSEYFDPGYTVNTIARGACAVKAPPVTHVGVCKMLKRGDGSMGMFQEISVSQWNDKDGQYFDAPAANWVEGMGLTCDNPIALGYKAAGYDVAWGGKPDPGHNPKGVRGAGFNNIYPYFVK